MTKIGILTFQNGYNRGTCDFYPLIRWKREFLNEGIEFTFFKNHKDDGLLKQDIVFIDHRFYRKLIVIKKIYSNKDFIRELISKLRSKGIKIILFDNGDGAGGRQWDMIEHVDIVVKKQVLKDKERYTDNRGVFSYMPFAENYDLGKDFYKRNIEKKKEFTPCPHDQLYKIKLGWNIGMKDYRWFPMSRYYPVGTNHFLNNIYKIPKFEPVNKERTIGSSFRGEIKSDRDIYSYQRNKVIDLFRNRRNTDLVTGDIVSKRKYLKELKNSKTCVSPFGWGEVCYRDFEAVLSGALLIKPDMDHLETYPDIYIKNETYVPLRWDMENLEILINDILNNYEKFIPLIENAQNIYKNALNDPDRFIDHLINIFDVN
jgi:hypothetical protein